MFYLYLSVVAATFFIYFQIKNLRPNLLAATMSKDASSAQVTADRWARSLYHSPDQVLHGEMAGPAGIEPTSSDS